MPMNSNSALEIAGGFARRAHDLHEKRQSISVLDKLYDCTRCKKLRQTAPFKGSDKAQKIFTSSCSLDKPGNASTFKTAPEIE